MYDLLISVSRADTDRRCEQDALLRRADLREICEFQKDTGGRGSFVGMIDPIELNRIGNRLLAERDYESAERVFRELVAEGAGSSAGYVGLAKVLERGQRFDEIITEIEPVARKLQDQRLLRAVADAYRVLFARGRKDLASRAIAAHEAYHTVKRDPVTLYHLGVMYFRDSRDYEKALCCFEESWRLDPRSKPAYEGVIASLRRLFRSSEIERFKQEWRVRNAGEEPPFLNTD